MVLQTHGFELKAFKLLIAVVKIKFRLKIYFLGFYSSYCFGSCLKNDILYPGWKIHTDWFIYFTLRFQIIFWFSSLLKLCGKLLVVKSIMIKIVDVGSQNFSTLETLEKIIWPWTFLDFRQKLSGINCVLILTFKLDAGHK